MPAYAGLFRDVIGPWAERLGRRAMGFAERQGVRGVQKGFSTIRSNAGFGWRALKRNPQRMMGVGQLRAMGRVAGAMRPGNIRALGGELGHMGKRWITGAEFTTGKMRSTAMALRGGALLGGVAAADFLNPWGLGWGD